MEAEAVPLIRRARGFRLYDRHGRRYLDLFRDGGGALLGHRSGSAVSEMKSALSQGLVSGVPSVWEARLVRMIAGMFPGHATIRLFSSRAKALEAVSCWIGRRVDPSDVHDPALGGTPSARASAALWRPWVPGSDSSPGAESFPVILPVLPLTVCGAPAPACFSGHPARPVPVSDRLPGFLLAGAFSGLVELRGSRSSFAVSPVIVRAIDSSKGWARAGPYVRATFLPDAFAGVFRAFLDAGVLLAPAYPGPSILPGVCSPGEARLLAELFSSIPGG
jgi:hypothetical protein